MKTATTFNIFLIIVLAFAGVSAQEVPKFIHYQGNLAQTNGNPVNDNLLMFFRVFDVEEGGTALWEELHNSISVEDGLFNVLLGSIDSANNPLTSALFSGERYLEIQIGQEILLPRQKIGSTPFAFTSSVSLSTRGIEVNSAGNVGIGTANPTRPVTVRASERHLALLDTDGSKSVVLENNEGAFKLQRGSADGETFEANLVTVDISSGNVGIGTTNSDGKLVINGSSTSTPSSNPSLKITGVGTLSMMTMGLRFSGADAWIQSNGHLLLQPEPGNVGIGTSNPQAMLEVNGSIKMRYSGTTVITLTPNANNTITHNLGISGTQLIFAINGDYDANAFFVAGINVSDTTPNRFTFRANGGGSGNARIVYIIFVL